MRVGLGHDVEGLLNPPWRLTSAAGGCVAMATAKQGLAIEATYAIELRSQQAAGDLVKALNRIEGVQNVALNRETAEG